MDPAAILALISNLYAQATQGAQTIEELRARIVELEAQVADSQPTPDP